MTDPNHIPFYVRLAQRLSAQRMPFACIGVLAPFCGLFKTTVPAANDAGQKEKHA